MEAGSTTAKWSFGGTLMGPAVRAVVRDPVGILLVPVLLQAPLVAFSAVEGARWSSVLEESADPFAAILWNGDAGGGSVWTILSWLLIAILLSCLANALVIRRTMTGLSSSGASLETDFRHAFARTAHYIVASVILFVISTLGAFLLVIPGLLALFFLFLAPILTVSEDAGVFESLGESARRVRANFGIWLGMVVLFLVAVVFLWVLSAALAVFVSAADASTSAPIGRAVASSLFWTVLGCFFTVAFTTLARFMGSTLKPSSAGAGQPEGEPETRSQAASLFE